MIHLAPGKPTDILTELNPKITPEARERLEKMYNLDKPIIIQYGLWLKKIVRFDFGDSFSTDRRPVIDKIWDREQPLIERRLFVTFMINAITAVVILMISIPIGITSAMRQNTFIRQDNHDIGFHRVCNALLLARLIAHAFFWRVSGLAADIRAKVHEL